MWRRHELLADPGSGDDTGEVDSAGSDFVASGGKRTAIRAVRFASPMFIIAKPFAPTKQSRLLSLLSLVAHSHRVRSSEKLAEQAQRSVTLLFVTPEQFARTFCADPDLPPAPWADTMAAQIRTQLEDQDGVGNMELAVGGSGDETPEFKLFVERFCSDFSL
ncbi:hypothetical protein EDB89DRAFT_2069869 [Lactarius sanguifluus]|nr:hypothetical protein EDB89DRAFT_2069869 [Lactarius sanguifluus]